jgi:hypothetical protein
VHIVIDAPPDLAVWRASFRQLLRGPVRRIRIVGIVLVLLGLVCALTDDGSGGLLLLGVLLVVLGLLYAVLIPVRSMRLSLRRIPPALQQPKRIELTEQSVKVTSPLILTEYAWAAFVRIQEIPGVLMLMPGRYQVVPVPIGGLAPHELAQLREFVANREFVRR